MFTIRQFSTTISKGSLIPLESQYQGLRIDKVLQKKCKIPWSLAHKLTRKKDVTVLSDGKYNKVTVDYKIQRGDILCLNDRAKLDHIDTKTSPRRP